MSLTATAFVPALGVPELLFVLFMTTIYASVAMLLIVGSVRLYWRVSGKADREERLERRVDELERTVESLQSDEEWLAPFPSCTS